MRSVVWVFVHLSRAIHEIVAEWVYHRRDSASYLIPVALLSGDLFMTLLWLMAGLGIDSYTLPQHSLHRELYWAQEDIHMLAHFYVVFSD